MCTAVGSAAVSSACSKRPPAPRRVALGPAAAISEGDTEFTSLRLLIRRRDNVFQAMSLTCTHQPCSLNRSEVGFVCPCHGSRFSSDGFVQAGPALKPLPFYRVSIESGEVLVDLGDEVGPSWTLNLQPEVRG